MKDIKIKNTNSNSKIHTKISSATKIMEHSARETTVEKIRTITEENRENSKDNPNNYAVDTVENSIDKAEEITKDTSVKVKNYAVEKVKEQVRQHRANADYENNSVPDDNIVVDIKTKDDVQSQSESSVSYSDKDIKTRENTEFKVEKSLQTNNTSSPETIKTQVQRESIKQKQADVNDIKTAQATDNTPIKTKSAIKKSEDIPEIDTKAEVTAKQINHSLKTRTGEMDIKTSDISVKVPVPNDPYIDKQVADVPASDSTFPIKDKQEVLKHKQIQKYAEHKKELEKISDSEIQTNTEIFPQVQINSDVPSTAINTDTHQEFITPNSDPEFINTIKTKDTMRMQRLSEGEADIKIKSNNSLLSKARVKQQSDNIRLSSEKLNNGKIKSKKSIDNSPIKTRKSATQKAIKKKFKINPAKKVKEKAKKEARKKAAKKIAQETAKRTQQAAKVTIKAVKFIAQKVAQLTAKIVEAVASAVAAFGGWVVLLVLLIIIAIVGAIAASPFGIFFSDENSGTDISSIPISSIVAECNMELSNKLTEIEDAAAPDRVVMDGEQANWSEVLAIFSVKVAGTDDETAQDVVIITEDKKQKLKEIFWEMNSISSHTETETKADGTTEKVLHITLNHKTKDDMISEYHFTSRQQEALATLLENGDVLVGATQSLAISDATAQEVLHSLPDSLSQDRKNVIKAACSLVGKVNYFWGGKSAAIGWDSNWGKMALVTAEGSRSSGSMRPFGLDCSGFVTWTFINSGKTAAAIGHGASTQASKCTRISWSAAQPGDLAFLSDLSHVGIVAGRDTSGNILVIHCSSGANNVVITTNSIFGFAGRPNCY